MAHSKKNIYLFNDKLTQAERDEDRMSEKTNFYPESNPGPMTGNPVH